MRSSPPSDTLKQAPDLRKRSTGVSSWLCGPTRAQRELPLRRWPRDFADESSWRVWTRLPTRRARSVVYAPAWPGHARSGPRDGGRICECRGVGIDRRGFPQSGMSGSSTRPDRVATRGRRVCWLRSISGKCARARESRTTAPTPSARTAARHRHRLEAQRRKPQ
jgi:hypothetical protein